MSNDQPNMIIYRTADGKSSVALFAKDGKIWLSQQQMAELFATSKHLRTHELQWNECTVNGCMKRKPPRDYGKAETDNPARAQQRL